MHSIENEINFWNLNRVYLLFQINERFGSFTDPLAIVYIILDIHTQFI